MEENSKKEDTINIITHINELISQTEVTQYFKNTKKIPIELEIVLPIIDNINITKFEVIKGNKKIISKLLEKDKAEEKYNDTIATGESGFISYNLQEETKICLGNISPGEELELKTYYFGHIKTVDLSYQAKFPVIFPDFVMEDPKFNEKYEYYVYKKKIVKGKIYLNTYSKITRLIIGGMNNFSKIEKKIGNNKLNIEIDIYKDNFSDKDIPGIIIFRTEKINEDLLYYQSDPKKNKSYYILQKTLNKPEFDLNLKDNIDENENNDYISLVKENEESSISKPKVCYLFLLDQSGSMNGERIELSCKSLLLFLQSLDTNCFFQLIGFGSDYEFFSEKPLEYNKENIKDLMDTIKNLKANRGGTELYRPLKKIYDDNIYNDFNMEKIIILLTDGELFDKEKVLNLIGANSHKFKFNSLGIGDCDKDLIERTALLGNGYSFYISNLAQLNSVVISLYEKTRNSFYINCKVNQECFIEDDNNYILKRYDYFKYGFILNEKEIKDNIEFIIKKDDNSEIKISFDKNKIIKIPDGDNLGKLIVDNYLKGKKCTNKNTRINLSKEYKILTKETAFYAEILNETPVNDKMITITNKDKVAENNINENTTKENNDYIFNDEIFGYDDIDKEEKPQEKKGWFSGFFSNLFNKDNKIDNTIKKKKYEYKEKEDKIETFKLKKKKYKKKNPKELAREEYEDGLNYIQDKAVDGLEERGGYYEDRDLDYCGCDFDCGYKISFSNYGSAYKTEYKYESPTYSVEKEEEEKEIPKNEIKSTTKKNGFLFDDFIIRQDIIEGNWTKDSLSEELINLEKDMYEKIKKFSEDKGIKDENGIMTLFALYYIHNKKKDKLNELKFVINKAKNYVKKVFKLGYDNIVKEIENK